MSECGSPENVGSMEGLGVGSMVWVFDINHRVYRERLPGEGYSGGGPIWRKHWVKREIVGETARSWLLQYGTKISKKAPGREVAFSEDELDRAAFVHDHSIPIADAVRRIKDYDELKAVAALIDYPDA